MNPSERTGAILHDIAYEHGATLVKVGRISDAIAHFEQALGESGLIPPSQEIVFSLADAYTRAGREQDAFRLYYEAAWSHPLLTTKSLTKAAALVKRLDADKAAQLLAYLDENKRGEVLGASTDTLGLQRMIRLGLTLRMGNHELASKLLDAPALAPLTKEQNQQLAQLAYNAGDEAFADPKRYDQAIHSLRMTLILDPGFLAAYWLLLEALRLRGTSTVPPNQADLEASAAVWEQAKPYGLPNADQSWCLLARAALNDPLAKMPNTQRWLLGWQAVCWCERSLLLVSTGIGLVNLAQWYRFVSLPASERAAYLAALEIDPDDAGAREAEIIWLANNGRFSEISEKIRVRRETDKLGWIDAVDAYVQLLTGHADEALTLIDQGIKTFDSVWCRALRINCLQILTRWDEVKQALLDVQLKYKPEREVDAIPLLAKAEWVQGDPQRAMVIARNYLQQEALPNDSQAYTSLGICCLAAGKPEQGRPYFIQGINTSSNSRLLDDLLRFEMPLLEHFVVDADKASVLAVLEGPDGWRSLVERRIEEVKDRTADPLQELEAAQRQFSDLDPGGWLTAAVRTGEARLRLSGGEWQTAAGLYIMLAAGNAELVPEASRGVTESIQYGLNAADAALKEGSIAEAASLYRQILNLFENGNDKDLGLEASAAAGMACAQLQLDNRRAAAHYLKQAAGTYRQSNLDWVQAAAHRIRKLIASLSQLWRLHDLLTGLEMDTADAVRQEDIASLRNGLLSWIEDYFQMSDNANFERTPTVAPIMLEVGTSLVKDGSDKGPLVSKLIPEVRKRIEDRMGFRIPSVRVRDNTALGENGYGILLRNVPLPLENGSVPLDRAFARMPASAIALHGVKPSDAIPALDPVTNTEGCWVTRGDAERIAATDIEIWNDPLEFVLRRVEALLMRHLDEFLGLDELEEITKEWQKSNDTRALLEEVLGKPAARIHLARLLRCLLREGISIARYFPEPSDSLGKPAPPAILHAIRDMNLNAYTLPAALMAVRLALRPLWQGKSTQLPVSWEQVSNRFASINALIRPDEFHWLIDSAREALQSDDSGIGRAIIVERPDIAPFLQVALRYELPAVRVFSKLECEAPQA